MTRQTGSAQHPSEAESLRRRSPERSRKPTLRTSIGRTANSSMAQNRTQQSRTWYIGNVI